MPDTWSSIYIHIVFRVKHSLNLIHPSWEERLHKYIAAIIINKEQKPIIVNGMPDHIHIVVGMKPSVNVSDLVREIKKSSAEFIKTNRFCKEPFYWQGGFGVYSWTYFDLPKLINYVKNQKEHHKQNSFKDEYMDMMRRFGEDKPEDY